MRVEYAAIDEEGNFISIYDSDPLVAKQAYDTPPAYSEQVYNTTYFLTSEQERTLFESRRK